MSVVTTPLAGDPANLVYATTNPLTGKATALTGPDGTATVGIDQTSASNQITLSDSAEAVGLKGFLLYQPDGTNNWQVATSAYKAGAKACTVTWSAGNVATITVTGGHGCVEQDAFVLQVADEVNDPKWAEVLRTVSVTDANTLTARLPFLPTAAPVGAVTFRRCTRNVVVDLDLDYNYAGNSGAGSTPARMAMVLAFLADSTIRVRGKNVYKYLVLAAGCDNCTFDVGSYPNSRSDTFKLYGPAANNTIKVYGQASEDCVSVQAMEPAAFIGYMPCRGNIRGTRLRDISAFVTTAGSGPVVIYADPTYTISGTVVDGGVSKALAGTADGLVIRAGSGFTATNANLIDVSIKNMAIGSAGGSCIAVRTPMRKLAIENCQIEAPGNTSLYSVYINNDVDVLEFVGQTFDFSGVATTGFLMYVVANVKTMVFRNCKMRGSSTARFMLFDGATSSLDTLIFDNCNIETMDVLARFEVAMVKAPTVIIRGGTISGVLTITNFRKTGGKLLLEGPTISGATNGVCRSEGAGVITDVYGLANLATPAQLAVAVSSGKVNLRTPWMSFDHTAAVLNNADGNEFVTSTAAGTLTVGMPVIGDGTLYRCRRDFTKTS